MRKGDDVLLLDAANHRPGNRPLTDRQFKLLRAEVNNGRTLTPYLLHLLEDHETSDGPPPGEEIIVGPVVIQMSGVQPERLRWLWKEYIPAGKLTLVDGDPGLGKSTATIGLMSTVTVAGRMPDATGAGISGPVILLSGEDGLADTVQPRLEAAGADLTKAWALTGYMEKDGFERPISFPDDTVWLESVVRERGAVAVVIDPLMAHLGVGVDAHKDQDVRRALAALATMADRTGAAIIMVRHLNKAGGRQALYRGGGSIGIAGAARSVLLVAQDPDDEGARILCRVKGNLSKEPPALRFKIVSSGDSSKVEWLGESMHRADALVAPPEDEEVTSAVADAMDFLLEMLRGGPAESKDLIKQAKDAGHADRALQRAKAKLGIKPSRRGFGGPWFWALPAEDGQGGPVTQNRHSSGGASTFGADGPEERRSGRRKTLSREQGLASAFGNGTDGEHGDDDAEVDL